MFSENINKKKIFLRPQSIVLAMLLCVGVLQTEAATQQKEPQNGAGGSRAAVTTTGVKSVNAQTERDVVVAKAYGDLTGDGTQSEIILMGTPFNDNSQFFTDLYLVVKNAATGKTMAVAQPAFNGYAGRIVLADVTGDGVPEILISAPTGGSGGIIGYRIFTLDGNNLKEIFTEENNAGVNVTGRYLQDFKLELVFNGEKTIIAEVPAEQEYYEFIGLYDTDGNVREENSRPGVQNLSGLVLLDTNGDGISEAVTTQRIVGVNNVDPVGLIRAVWSYTPIGWSLQNYTYLATFSVKSVKAETYPFIGLGGYVVQPEQAAAGPTQIVYPVLTKFTDKERAWLVNNAVAEYVRSEFEGIYNKGYLILDYQVKYAGKNLLSIVFTGRKEGLQGEGIVYKCMNFDLTTGRLLTMKELLGTEKKVWQKIQEKAAVTGTELGPDSPAEFYYDGRSFIFTLAADDETGKQQVIVPKEELNNLLAAKLLVKQN